MKKIFVFEMADLRFASRARKEAFSLASKNYNVTLIGINSELNSIREYQFRNVNFIEYPLKYDSSSILKKLISEIKLNLQMVSFFLTNKADVYHMHDLRLTLMGWIGKKIHKGFLIYDAHELHSEKREILNRKDKIFRFRDMRKEKSILKYSDVVIQANEERALLFSQIYNTKVPVVIENHVAVNSVDKESSMSIREITKFKDKKIIIFIGRVTYGINQKVDNVIRALKHLQEEFVLVMLGSVSEDTKNKLTEIASELKVKDRIRFVPPVPSDELVSVISSADISVIPVYADCKNSEHSALNKLSQSLLAGLPVVSSNYENLVKILDNSAVGTVGFTFNVENPEEIAIAIRSCIDSPSYEIYRRNARTIAMNFLNWEIEEKKLFSIYENLLK